MGKTLAHRVIEGEQARRKRLCVCAMHQEYFFSNGDKVGIYAVFVQKTHVYEMYIFYYANQ